MTLLQEVAQERLRSREVTRVATRTALSVALKEILPRGTTGYLFGSITEAGRFSEASDLDLGLEGNFSDGEITRIAVLLEERLGRPVDILVLEHSRLAPKIRRKGEKWTV